MRKMKKPPAEELRKRKEEPLAEGLQIVVPTDSRGRRQWSRMADEQIVEFARRALRENGISTRNELRRTDSGLEFILRKRGLLAKVGFEEKRRDWSDMENNEIIELARKCVEENEIVGRVELKETDAVLYDVLRKRNLLDDVGFEEKQRSWSDIGDDEIVEIAQAMMEKLEITERRELRDADPGLYAILSKRKLIDKVGFEDKQRSWKGMADEEIVEFAKRLIEENGISGKTELMKDDRGVYWILTDRGLLDAVGFVGKKQRKKRSWKSMGDAEVVAYAKRIMEENGIAAKHELEGADSGLYRVLKERGLLEEAGVEKKRRKARSWKDMSNEEIVEYAKKVIHKKGISGRYALDKIDSGLYSVLKRRGLLARTFRYIDQQKEEQARDAVIDALEAFASNDNSSAEDDVA